MAKTPPKINRAEMPGHFFSKWVPDTRPVRTKPCDHPGCESVGEYRAPAHHYKEEVQVSPLNIIDEKKEQTNRWFCLDHVKEYNASWDYYAGLNEQEMEEAIRSDVTWNRPTWRFGQWGPKAGRDKVTRTKYYHRPPEEERAQEATEASAALLLEASRGALAELGLEPPVEFPEIKKRYRELVKRHHPDMQTEDATHSGDETIRRLNAAFTLLKGLYAKRKAG